MNEIERYHEPATCPKCGCPSVPVYELAVPKSTSGFSMGAKHLDAHGCPEGGDHLKIQGGFTYLGDFREYASKPPAEPHRDRSPDSQSQ